MERDIEFFAELTGEHTTSKEFSETAKARQIAIDSILWNSEMEQWLDYWLPADVQCQVLQKEEGLCLDLSNFNEQNYDIHLIFLIFSGCLPMEF
jgi:neutral trehalase